MAGKEFTYGTSASNLQITEKMLIDLAKETFTGYSGNKKKILLAGSGLIANLSNIEFKNKYVQNFTDKHNCFCCIKFNWISVAHVITLGKCK